MGKIAARIYRWILLSVILQVFFLMFLNNYVSRTGKLKFTSVELSDDISNTIEIKLPTKAENFKVSHDGNYLAYMINGKIVIMDLVAEQPVKTIEGKEGPVIYYRWLPDRNMVIYATDVSTQYSGKIKLKTYEIDTDIEREYPVLKNLSKPCKVDAVELSTFTKVLYVKISNNSGRAVIYKFNIMNNLSWVMETDSRTVIYEANLCDMLFYQNDRFKIAYRDGSDGSRKTLGFSGKMALLAVDSEDRVYTGELDEDNNIKAIHYGKIDEPLSSWKIEKLEKPVKPEQIYITRNGSIYMVSEDSNTIRNIVSGKEKELKGKIVDIINGFVAMKNGDTFILEELN